MRRVVRFVNILTGALCLASGGATLWSWLMDPGYRVHYGDPLWVLVAYVAFYGWVLTAMWRDDAWAPRLAVTKAVGAYAFLFTFPWVGPLWMARTPGRYVYELFDWGAGLEWILMAYVLLGRGVWNTVNAMAFTMPWWTRIRSRRPIVGRLLTAIPLLFIVSFVWAYRELVRVDRATFSAEASTVAEAVLADLDCDAIRTARSPTSRDRRRRGEREYEVHIQWNCLDLQVLVQDPDGRIGTARSARPDCCPPDAS